MSDDLVYFLHIPKTAGTSLLHFFFRSVGEHRVANILWDQLVAGTDGITGETRVVSGHLAGLLPLWLRKRPRIVTMLREPVARALSHINHVQRIETHPLHEVARGKSVEEYCTHPDLRRTVDNFQARYLASLSFADALVPDPAVDRPFGTVSVAFENALYSLDAGVDLLPAALRAVDRVDAVGLCEAVAPSVRLFAAVLGWPAEAEASWANRADERQRSVATLTPAERSVLERLTAIDAAIYRHACERFRELCERYGISPETLTPPAGCPSPS